jgi:hypothetical protein
MTILDSLAKVPNYLEKTCFNCQMDLTKIKGQNRKIRIESSA